MEMKGDLNIKKATIHYIYSFMPSSNELTLHKETLETLFNSYKKIENSKGGRGKPKNRIGISTYMRLKQDMGYLIFSKLEGKVENLDIEIESTIRNYPLGSSCCLSVSTVSEEKSNDEKREINTDDINKLLHLVSQLNNYESKFKITIERPEDRKGEKSLYKIFREFVDEQIAAYNSIIDEENEKTKKEHIKLKCTEYLDDKPKEKKGIEPQTPWVVTVLEVEGESYDTFCGSFYGNINPFEEKNHAIKKYEKLIAPILYRSVMGEDFQLEPAYKNWSESAGLGNMNIEARLFVQMSRRSILCICKDQDENPANYFLPVLLDICEMAYTRWHSMIILNKILDDSLKNFSDKKMRPKERLDRILKLINKFVSCLEDPSAYVVSGDALREIHEKLLNLFRLSELSGIVLKKLDMLEKIYNIGFQTTWLSDDTEYED